MHTRDALKLRASDLDPAPTALVANLPYNVAVPVVLHLLAELPALRHGLVMVQKEVADRLTAAPGSKVYGVPSVKLAWYASARLAGRVPASVFWPVPNVESGLVAFTRREPPAGVDRDGGVRGHRRRLRPAAQDAAFGARRLGRRSRRGGRVDPGPRRASPPTARGEELDVEQFAAIAAAGPECRRAPVRWVHDCAADRAGARRMWTPDPVRQRLADYTIEDVLAPARRRPAGRAS